MLDSEKWIGCMTENTASTLLAEMKPAWRAALGDRVSHEYVAGFIRRNRVRLESVLAPIAAACLACRYRWPCVQRVRGRVHPT